MKRENRRLKNDLEARIKEHEFVAVNQHQNNQHLPVTYQQPNPNPIIMDSVKVDDYSKVFTEDMGVIDDRFFEASSPFRSPKNNMRNSNNNNNREAQHLKRISELQL